VPNLQPQSLRRHTKKRNEDALEGNIQSVLHDLTYVGAAKGLVGIGSNEYCTDEYGSDKQPVLDCKEAEDQLHDDGAPTVTVSNEILLKKSIFDFVMEMDRQFDDLFRKIELTNRTRKKGIS